MGARSACNPTVVKLKHYSSNHSHPDVRAVLVASGQRSVNISLMRRVCRPLGATAFPGVKNVDYLEGFDENGEDYYSILGVVRPKHLIILTNEFCHRGRALTRVCCARRSVQSQSSMNGVILPLRSPTRTKRISERRTTQP